MINFSPGVSLTTVASPNSSTVVSSLTIQQTRPEDTGNYSCAPPLGSSDSVKLFVAQSNSGFSLGNSYFPRSDVSDPSLALQQSLSSSSSSSSELQFLLILLLLTLTSLA